MNSLLDYLHQNVRNVKNHLLQTNYLFVQHSIVVIILIVFVVIIVIDYFYQVMNIIFMDKIKYFVDKIINNSISPIIHKEHQQQVYYKERKAYGVHTYLHPFGCRYGVKEGIDGVRPTPEVRSVWGALFSRYSKNERENDY